MFFKRSETLKSARVPAHLRLFITAKVSKMGRDGIEPSTSGLKVQPGHELPQLAT
jgi:hypothetical protein